MLIETRGYFDLSISSKFNFDNLEYIKQLGYSVIAINQYVEESDFDCKKQAKKKRQAKDKVDVFPEPIKVSEVPGLKVLNRLTFEFSDSSIVHKMNQSDNLRKYDLIAVIPKTLSAFQYACCNLDIDIITFDPYNKLPFKLHRRMYRQAMERFIFFELMYSPAIRDSTCRKNIICTAHQYHAVGKSGNVIVTSGTDDKMMLRGVYDVTNLGLLFGLNERESREVITTNARKAILRAESRRRGKVFVIVNKKDNENGSDSSGEESELEPNTKKLKICD